jgi:hypothetical protein
MMLSNADVGGQEQQNLCYIMAIACWCLGYSIKMWRPRRGLVPPKLHFRIEKFTKTECRSLFRFKKKHLYDLFYEWGVYNLPETVRLPYDQVAHREEMF